MDMDQPYEYLQKISKIPLSILREKGLLTVVYPGYSYLQGDDYEDCFSNVLNPVEILNLLDSQSIQTNPNSYQHNVSPT